MDIKVDSMPNHRGKLVGTRPGAGDCIVCGDMATDPFEQLWCLHRGFGRRRHGSEWRVEESEGGVKREACAFSVFENNNVVMGHLRNGFIAVTVALCVWHWHG
jgi:hypothetical protein